MTQPSFRKEGEIKSGYGCDVVVAFLILRYHGIDMHGTIENLSRDSIDVFDKFRSVGFEYAFGQLFL